MYGDARVNLIWSEDLRGYALVEIKRDLFVGSCAGFKLAAVGLLSACIPTREVER